VPSTLFIGAIKRPKQVALGVALQYSIMPLLGFAIGGAVYKLNAVDPIA
jgi:predicted Na+-dependent transporter